MEICSSDEKRGAIRKNEKMKEPGFGFRPAGDLLSVMTLCTALVQFVLLVGGRSFARTSPLGKEQHFGVIYSDRSFFQSWFF